MKPKIVQVRDLVRIIIMNPQHGSRCSEVITGLGSTVIELQLFSNFFSEKMKLLANNCRLEISWTRFFGSPTLSEPSRRQRRRSRPGSIFALFFWLLIGISLVG